MKLDDNPRIPINPVEMARVLQLLFQRLAAQVNGISTGRVQAVTNADSAAPTAGDYNVGDFVRNSLPTETGGVGVKYVVTGWVCTSSAPLVFLECRAATGN